MVVEVIDAPWAGVPRGSDGLSDAGCREHACQTVTFLEHDERMCAPRARLGARAIRWAIRQLRFKGATIAPGPPTGNHVEYRVVPYQAVSASRI